MFLGVDIKALHKDVYLAVRDITKEAYVVSDQEDEHKIPIGKVELKLEPMLKTTKAVVVINKLQVQRVYIDDAHPERRRAEDVAMSPYGDLTIPQDSCLQSATGSDDTPVPMTSRNYGLQTDARKRTTGNQESDLVRVSFGLASPQPLLTPFVFLIARFHEKGSREAKYWFYGKRIDPVREQEAKVDILRARFPVGCEIENMVVHVFNEGSECGTNLSENRIALSEESAFQYLTFQYLSAHQSDTTKPSVAIADLSPYDITCLTQMSKKRPCYAKVDAQGRVTGVYDDAACTKPPKETALPTIVAKIRFFPALNAGKPVDGIAGVHPGELVYRARR